MSSTFNCRDLDCISKSTSKSELCSSSLFSQMSALSSLDRPHLIYLISLMLWIMSEIPSTTEPHIGPFILAQSDGAQSHLNSVTSALSVTFHSFYLYALSARASIHSLTFSFVTLLPFNSSYRNPLLIVTNGGKLVICCQFPRHGRQGRMILGTAQPIEHIPPNFNFNEINLSLLIQHRIF